MDAEAAKDEQGFCGVWAFEGDDRERCYYGEGDWKREDGGEALEAEPGAGAEDV